MSASTGRHARQKATVSCPWRDRRVILSSARCRRRPRSMPPAYGAGPQPGMPDFWYGLTGNPLPTVMIMTTQTVLMQGITKKTIADMPATGDPTALDRYVLDSRESGGAIAIVEHSLAPRVLAAPVHRH